MNDSATAKYGITVTGQTIIRPTSFDKIDGRSSDNFMAVSAAS